MNRDELWRATLAKLELAISRPNFITWFQETGITALESGLVTICVPNGFAKEWLQNKYHRDILHALRELNHEVKDVHYIIGKPPHPAVVTNAKQKTHDGSSQALDTDDSSIRELTVNPETNLNPRYTFKNFVVGSFNELAYAAAQSVIKNPGVTYNPLFVYGGVGLGKTHLIQAIGNEMLRENPQIKVRYVPSEKYMGEIVDALRNQEINQLKEKYRTIDLLIMDDLQFIARTEKMQEEFFHTFNALFEKNKQLIISSDRPPQAIPTLEKRLGSRLEGGMLADIGQPDFETRLLILKTKMGSKQVSFPDKILETIADLVRSNIRELEGALNKVIMTAKLSNAPIDTDTVQKIILSHQANAKKFVSFKKIIKAVSEFYDIDEKEIMNHSRRRDIVKPRQIAMYLLREELHTSYPSIGEKFGGRDHTTAIHSCEKVGNSLKTSSELEEEIRVIKEKIYSA